jgi:hypothetical protein
LPKLKKKLLLNRKDEMNDDISRMTKKLMIMTKVVKKNSQLIEINL